MTDIKPAFGISRRLAFAGATTFVAVGTPSFAAEPQFWTARYTAKKGDVSLAMYRKRLAAPKPGEAKLPVLFLVHGSSVSALPTYDLTVPGAGEYSLMNVFARFGFDVWAMDHEGYGNSTITSGNSDIASGVADLQAAFPIVERETGQKMMHMFGESSGAIRVAAFSVAEPTRVDRMVLTAYTYTGKGSPTLAKRAEGVEFFRTHNRRPRGRDMIESIFTRDRAGTADQRVAVAMADAEMVHGDTIPTGTYLDMTANLPIVDPTKITRPFQILRGQYDGIATDEDLIDFFAKVPVQDKQYIVIPGASHSVTLGYGRKAMWQAVQSFLTMPGPDKS